MTFVEAGEGYHHLFTGWVEPRGDAFVFVCAATGAIIDLEDFEPQDELLGCWTVLDRLEHGRWSMIGGLHPAPPEMIAKAEALMRERRVRLKMVA
ncbi:hypothetical protein [Sphingomicrobium arenosum]|uniref:hypothetical protein n=1 Tax=Sphingomicrobium arenosum TaxID=2233861 RepID=UPI00223EF438|nr:hypothetical protein [Sphingomicrobium arenosum]